MIRSQIRCITLTGVTLLCGVFMAACSNAGYDGATASVQTAQEPETLVTVMTNDLTLRGFPEYLEALQKDTELRIQVLAAPDNPNDRLAKFNTILSSGDTNVDILSVNDEMLSQFKRLGYLAPLEKTVMTPDILEQFYMDFIMETAVFDGSIYAVPQHAEVLAFWVDQSLLKEVGLDTIATREDFDFFLESCARKGVYGYGGAWEKTYVFNEICTFVAMFGGDYLDWQNPKSQEAVEYLYNISHLGYTPIEQVSQQYDAMVGKFIHGEYGSIFMWNNFTQRLLDSGRYVSGEIKMRPIPLFGEEKAYMASWHYVLNQACSEKGEALKLLSYLASRDGQKMDAKYLKRYPARKDVLYDEALSIEGLDELKYYLENYELHARPMAPDAMPFIEGMGDLFHKYIFDEISLDIFCAKAQEFVNQYMR